VVDPRGRLGESAAGSTFSEAGRLLGLRGVSEVLGLGVEEDILLNLYLTREREMCVCYWLSKLPMNLPGKSSPYIRSFSEHLHVIFFLACR